MRILVILSIIIFTILAIPFALIGYPLVWIAQLFAWGIDIQLKCYYNRPTFPITFKRIKH